MNYSLVVESYEKLEGHTGRLAITGVLADLLKETPKSELPMLVYLTQGKLRPDYEGIELGIAEKYALRVLHLATGASLDQVRKTYVTTGDIGSAAQKLLDTERQGALNSEKLSLKRVYDTLFDISKMSGQGSTESKLNELVGLIADATPVEAKYVLRTAMGVLRLGVADYTILDA